ncbi:MAG: hypothetical protein NTZ05_11545, partial [Chloroflexi bacterium]|nr:hypothetical protein [Chloroflexota bacterium]
MRLPVSLSRFPLRWPVPGAGAARAQRKLGQGKTAAGRGLRLLGKRGRVALRGGWPASLALIAAGALVMAAAVHLAGGWAMSGTPLTLRLTGANGSLSSLAVAPYAADPLGRRYPAPRADLGDQAGKDIEARSELAQRNKGGFEFSPDTALVLGGRGAGAGAVPPVTAVHQLPGAGGQGGPGAPGAAGAAGGAQLRAPVMVVPKAPVAGTPTPGAGAGAQGTGAAGSAPGGAPGGQGGSGGPGGSPAAPGGVPPVVVVALPPGVAAGAAPTAVVGSGSAGAAPGGASGQPPAASPLPQPGAGGPGGPGGAGPGGGVNGGGAAGGGAGGGGGGGGGGAGGGGAGGAAGGGAGAGAG